MDKKLISICIPTYNRAEFLNQTIYSVISQIPENLMDRIELVISDNASVDNTESVVMEWKKKSPISIIYNRNPVNLGADRNYLKVVELASGDYCWFLGSDDALVKDSIQYVCSQLGAEELILLNRVECDFNLNPLYERRWLKLDGERVFDLGNKDELMEYFNLSLSIGAVFSYLSSIIFKKNEWDRVRDNDSFIGSFYIHVYKIMGMIKNSTSCRLKYIDKPLVLCRGENDSFLQGNEVRRALIDFEGYINIADFFFYDDKELRKAFLSILKREHPVYRFLKYFALLGKAEFTERKLLEERLMRSVEIVGYNKAITLLLKEIGYAFPDYALNLYGKIKSLRKR